MKKIGIIVPIYNVEPYLKKCINSIIHQTYENIKIVLVNDGSTDESGKICDEYAKLDQRISVIHQNNQGPIIARYNGLKSLECDYATFIDGDDWIDQQTYEKMAHYLENDIDMVTYGIIRYYDEHNQNKTPHCITPGIYQGDAIQKNIYPTMLWDISKHICGLDASLCNKIVKKDLYLKSIENAKNLHMHYGEDVAVVYPLVMHLNSMVISGECLYYHRQRNVGEIASYVLDDNYFDNLLVLYNYLKRVFVGKADILKQLEYFYLHAVEVRLRIYGERKTRKGYVFPFDLVKNKSKIIIYGAGEVGQVYHEQVNRIQYCEVLAWVDRNFDKYDSRVLSPDKIKDIGEYDYIIIAIRSKDIAEEVRETLLDLNVEQGKIVWSVR